MKEQENGDWSISRRNVITHIGAGVFGWLVGTFLDPLRRAMNRLILNTPIGRKAQVNFAYASSPELDDVDYTVYITNNGSETAENLYAHLAFEERIKSYNLQDWINTAPVPDTDIQITEEGIARINIEFIRRNVQKHWNPISIEFSVEEGTTSELAYEINEGNDIFTSYRYSWTFLGERYYESTEHHISDD